MNWAKNEETKSGMAGWGEREMGGRQWGRRLELEG